MTSMRRHEWRDERARLAVESICANERRPRGDCDLSPIRSDFMSRSFDPANPHPPGRRRPRSRVREDGYETWTVKESQYFAIREVIEEGISLLDKGAGVPLSDLIHLATEKLTGHADFESGRFTNWVRWIKVDMEVEGAIEVVAKSSPQRVRFSS